MAVFLVALPDAVTTHEDEIVVFTQLDYFYVREAGNGLSVVWQVRVFLVVEVTEASRKIEVVVYPSTLDLESRGYDALQLKRIFRFVVVGKLDE